MLDQPGQTGPNESAPRGILLAGDVAEEAVEVATMKVDGGKEESLLDGMSE